MHEAKKKGYENVTLKTAGEKDYLSNTLKQQQNG
jgi:hypothetical protein